MAVRFSSGHERFGFEALVLENELLRIEVLPELGGKIWSILYKPHDRELLWHNPGITPQRVTPGAGFDDAFSGGWDELFPNDAPVEIDGLSYPDHGELWTADCSWQIVQESPEAITLALHAIGAATGATIERRLTLRSNEANLQIDYSVRNTGDRPLPFHWKLHPALSIGPNARLDIPAKRVIFDPEFAEEFAVLEGDWPIVPGKNGEPIDLRVLPHPVSKSTRFFYATDLTEGWCAVTDLDDALTVRFDFDPAVFPAVTVFGTYGGWRDLHVTILEPCTGYPYRLEEALDQGRARVLGVGEVFVGGVELSVSGRARH